MTNKLTILVKTFTFACDGNVVSFTKLLNELFNSGVDTNLISLSVLVELSVLIDEFVDDGGEGSLAICEELCNCDAGGTTIVVVDDVP